MHTADDTDIGGFTMEEFADLFRISRSTSYAERRSGRLKTSKIRNKTIVTRPQARAYQALLEAEADQKEAADAAAS